MRELQPAFHTQVADRTGNGYVHNMPHGWPPHIQNAFDHCERITRAHYENFPVASLLLPPDMRPYVSSIYAFARTADDFSDEGIHTPEDRLRLLDEWERQLDDCFRGKATNPIFVALGETVSRKSIPREPLARLIQAFRIDVTTRRFNTFEDLLLYCRHSANPVGQLVLHVFDSATPEAMKYSDSICTGLQLANFWQDLSVDREKGRLYIPLEDLPRFGYTEQEFEHQVNNEAFRALMRWEVLRAREFLLAGLPLLGLVGRRLRFELDLTIRGGLRILRKIGRMDYDVLARRPILSAGDKLIIVTGAALRRSV